MGTADSALSGGRIRLPGRLLVVAATGSLPPHHGGGAQVMSRMLGPIDPRDFVVVSFGPEWQRTGVMPSLGARRYRLAGGSWPPPKPIKSYPLDGMRARRKLVAETLRRARLMARLARREGCDGILATSSASPDIPAAWLAARWLRIPLAIYLMDDWRYLVAVRHPAVLDLATWMQALVLKHSAAVMAISPLLAADLEREWGISTHVVSHALPSGLSLDERPAKRPWPYRAGEIRLVFTGQVYEAHYDAMRTIVRALDEPGLEQVTLHIYSVDKPERLHRLGIRGRFVTHPPVASAELIEVQRSADVLLLPLGYDTGFPEIIRTAVPTKMAEYMVSGRPVLTFAPPDSVLAAIASMGGSAALVTSPDYRDVSRTLRRLIDDADSRDKAVEGAWRTAARYFSPEVTTLRFRSIVNAMLRRQVQRAHIARGFGAVEP